ncbi:hypothetical protein K7I13_03520 [Brucepastera parasyntrophica]|uniref:hypothetical protein n=1 Tax=Brucepastera parasyntrophica TaxID=2880008 RepID=UPI00210E2A58|nr:hypothetical protein [Brucepastera parasyntrophica]ULQ60389.1 hypothetical protein K7I13_03520 [Brucepastera parasyntrophica]
MPKNEDTELYGKLEHELQEATESFIHLCRSFPHIKNLYMMEHTNAVCNARNLQEKSFYKKIERMNGKNGLYNDPVLLLAVTKDLGISIQEAFSLKKTKILTDQEVTQALVSSESLRLIHDTVQHAVWSSRKPSQNISFRQKYYAAGYILFYTNLIMSNSLPTLSLFLCGR